MGKILDILCRLARAASAVSPERAAVLFAAAHPPGFLVAFLLWVAEGLAMDLLKLAVISPLVLYLWRRLTPEERRRARELWDRLLPTIRDGGDAD